MPTPPLSREKMIEALQAVKEAGNISAAARLLDIPRNTIKSRLKRAEEEGLHLSDGIRTAVNAANVLPGETRHGWSKVTDDDGNNHSIFWKTPQITQEDLAERLIDSLSDVPAVAPVAPPEYSDNDLCTVYTIADRHQGMRAWAKEVGADYDNKIAKERLCEWMGRCIASSPPSGTAIILDIGDGEHIDDQTNATPRSKHQLDVDSRVFMTIDASVSSLAYSVDAALQKHAHVIVRILPGNHNPTLYMAVMFSLAERYRNEPRVDVQKVPGEFFAHQFGKCFLAAHHGDKSKPERTVMFLADQYAKIWGDTSYRFLWTGHLHHHKSADIGGVQWEQLRAVCERDAHAVSSSYSGRAQLSALTLHKERGEIQKVFAHA